MQHTCLVWTTGQDSNLASYSVKGGFEGFLAGQSSHHARDLSAYSIPRQHAQLRYASGILRDSVKEKEWVNRD